MPLAIELVVLNKLGLHARPASEFVRCAQRYPDTTLILRKDGEAFSAHSILEILMANLDEGSVFTLEADGPGAEQAAREMTALLVRFREDDDEAAA